MTSLAQQKPRACLTIDEINVGDITPKEYIVTEEMVEAFAKISGDFNPIHLNTDYAQQTKFGQKIAHGTISIGQFSGIFGMDSPGLGALWVSKKITYANPVFLNTPYTAIAEVIDVSEKLVTYRTYVTDAEGNIVLDGESVLAPIPAKTKAKLDLKNLLDES